MNMEEEQAVQRLCCVDTGTGNLNCEHRHTKTQANVVTLQHGWFPRRGFFARVRENKT